MKRLFLLAFIWGWSFVFIKVAVEGMSPPTVAAARVGLGALALLVILRARGESLPRDPTVWKHFTVVALTGSAVPFTMLAWGEERITSALTAVLNASTPLFTALAAALLLRDRLRGGQIVGLLIGLAGVAVAAGLGGADLADSSFAGSMASVGAGAFYGLAFVYMRRHLVGMSPIVAAAGQLTMATLVLLPFAVATSIGTGIHLQPHRVLSVVLLGVVGTGLAYILNYQVVRDLGPTKASLVTYVIPVVAVIVGIVVLDERFELRLLFGGTLIVLGIAVVHERIITRPLPATVGPLAIVVLLLLVPLASCGTGGASEGCGPDRRESLDSNLGHVLPGAPEPRYLTDPPTSGPHQPGPPIAGVVDEPIAPPLQVGLLEEGSVLIQHRDLDAAAERELDALASDTVVVAPDPDLGDPIVATAWVHKLTCSTVDTDALQQFIDDRVGGGPGADG